MKNLYGYKEKDVIEFMEFLKERKGESLSSVFEKYAFKTGKSKGTIRNLYYAVAKKASNDKNFCKTYLNGENIKVNNIDKFNKEEERSLIKKIFLLTMQGKSVRKAVNELSKGDLKLALRYQNKFRNVQKDQKTVSEIVEEIKKETGKEVTVKKPQIKEYFSEFQFERLKSEINGLVEKISYKTKKENEFLKERISSLEFENLRLNNLLYGKSVPKVKGFFLNDLSGDIKRG